MASRRTSKGLEQLIEQALTDEDFIRELEADPAAALKKHGYPHDRALVEQIENINFAVFKRSFRKGGRARQFFC